MPPAPPGPGSPSDGPLLSRLVVVSWLGSRLLFFGSLAVAVAVTAPGQLAERLSSWDGAHYLRIAQQGYADSNLAFFPAFPATVRLVSDLLPLPPLVVALMLSNGAFLIALALLHRLSERWLGAEAARATVLLTCLNPLSLFFSLPYTESFFLLFSTLSLTWLGQDPIPSLRLAPIAALCAASRPNGVAIVVPILLAYGRQRRLGAGLLVAIASLGGLAAVALIGLHLRADPLAFLHAQEAWGNQPGLNFSGLSYWGKDLTKVFFGAPKAGGAAPQPLLQPVLMTITVLLGGIAFQLRHRRPTTGFALSLVAFVGAWLVGGMSALNLMVVVGAILLLLLGRRDLPLELWGFAAACLLLYLMKQNTMSLERHVFATAPLLMLYGAQLQRHPRWLVFLLGFGTLQLVLYALRLAHGLWIG
ncbi:mannosyltransferase family protein [Cyanobium sp. Morenito 9A2]|uniref:mannosyltransferase family protein n=1 Tax=Cyanobium sp. Morenito 9A2 TaxID=2823718 RepID=UPI0020CFC7A9|nr:mannosyltransferase family protein [Cyanobium sp. Morenito 9A2]MCP9849952.1 hypothetical protein [Cyanobium sp. Morenito 9A2]